MPTPTTTTQPYTYHKCIDNNVKYQGTYKLKSLKDRPRYRLIGAYRDKYPQPRIDTVSPIHPDWAQMDKEDGLTTHII
jgi:hypothetical protein